MVDDILVSQYPHSLGAKTAKSWGCLKFFVFWGPRSSESLLEEVQFKNQKGHLTREHDHKECAQENEEITITKTKKIDSLSTKTEQQWWL